jgi:hypothetical protein
MKKIPKLRWLKLIRVHSRWDSLYRESIVTEYPAKPVLQYWTGKKWVNVPTIERKEHA